MAEMAYNLSVEVNKVVTCGDFLFPALLPHFRQFNTFGGRTPGFTHHTRETPALHFLASTTESGVKPGAFSFLPKMDNPGRCANINQGLPRKKGALSTMGTQNIPSPKNFNNSQSSESNSDSLTLQLTEAQTNIEQIKERIYTAMDELAGWMLQLKALQEAADPFREFISGLDFDEPGACQ